MPLSILHIATIAVVVCSTVGADPELVDRAKLTGVGCQQTDTCLAPPLQSFCVLLPCGWTLRRRLRCSLPHPVNTLHACVVPPMIPPGRRSQYGWRGAPL